VKGEVAPVSAIADVLALWGMDGWLTPPLAPVVSASSVVSGRALTVQLAHDTSGPGLSPIYDVLSADLTDRVVVIAGARPVPGAVFGEILAGAARQQGAVGVLVDGWVRDRDDMTAIGLPVLAVGERVVGPNGSAHLLSVGETVAVDGVTVDDGDVIVIDPSGCVRIPAARADDVLGAATRYATAEVLVADALAAGEPLAAAYRHKRAMLAELAELARLASDRDRRG
jgi:4-hydroxy-4-methyl-2-oxoglutarate aldolase